jgi:putative membrane protein
MMGYYGYSGMGLIGMILSSIVFVVFVIGLVLLIVWVVRRMGANNSHYAAQSPASPTARDIAQMRYAKGEITREEYQQIITDLGH